MRHRKKTKHLGRTRTHRRAMLANMASSLIIHKRIHTTLTKAKALRPYIEPLITRSKNDSTHSRRVVFSYLQNKEAVTELFREVSQKIVGRPGGYTRILKTENRLGDNAQMCMIELVDYNENLLADAKERKSKTTRRGGRRRSRKKTDKAQAPTDTKQKEEVEDVKTDIEEPEKEAKDKSQSEETLKNKKKDKNNE